MILSVRSCAAIFALFLGLGLPWVPTVHAQDTSNQSTSSSTSPVLLAQPFQLEVPNFINDIDRSFMSDELTQQMEKNYADRLREISLRRGYYSLGDSRRLNRPFLDSYQEEEKIRKDMARSMRQYMLVRGLPQFLASRSATRFIGESYQKTMSFAQNATRLDFQKQGSKWKFSAGVNPFTSRSWIRYYNDQWNLEAWEDIDTFNNGALLTSYKIHNYQWQHSFYHHTLTSEPLFRISHSQFLSSEYRLSIPLESDNIPENTVGWLSATYKF